MNNFDSFETTIKGTKGENDFVKVWDMIHTWDKFDSTPNRVKPSLQCLKGDNKEGEFLYTDSFGDRHLIEVKADFKAFCTGNLIVEITGHGGHGDGWFQNSKKRNVEYIVWNMYNGTLESGARQIYIFFPALEQLINKIMSIPEFWLDNSIYARIPDHNYGSWCGCLKVPVREIMKCRTSLRAIFDNDLCPDCGQDCANCPYDEN